MKECTITTEKTIFGEDQCKGCCFEKLGHGCGDVANLMVDAGLKDCDNYYIYKIKEDK